MEFEQDDTSKSKQKQINKNILLVPKTFSRMGSEEEHKKFLSPTDFWQTDNVKESPITSPDMYPSIQ